MAERCFDKHWSCNFILSFSKVSTKKKTIIKKLKLSTSHIMNINEGNDLQNVARDTSVARDTWSHGRGEAVSAVASRSRNEHRS